MATPVATALPAGYIPLTPGALPSYVLNQSANGAPPASSYSPLTSPSADASARLEDMAQRNDLNALTTAQALQQLQFQATERQEIGATVHTMANQAEAFATQVQGDQIAEAKKVMENASKAV